MKLSHLIDNGLSHLLKRLRSDERIEEKYFSLLLPNLLTRIPPHPQMLWIRFSLVYRGSKNVCVGELGGVGRGHTFPTAKICKPFMNHSFIAVILKQLKNFYRTIHQGNPLCQLIVFTMYWCLKKCFKC